MTRTQRLFNSVGIFRHVYQYRRRTHISYKKVEFSDRFEPNKIYLSFIFFFYFRLFLLKKRIMAASRLHAHIHMHVYMCGLFVTLSSSFNTQKAFAIYTVG